MNGGAHGGQIFRKYMLTTVALVGGVLLASGLAELAFAYQDNRAALIRLQREQAAAAAVRIEQFLGETARQIGASAPGVSPEQTRDELHQLLRVAPAVTEVSYIDPAGREQVRVSRLVMDAQASNVDYSAAPAFTVPRRGSTYFGPVYLRRESEPYMTIAVADRMSVGLPGAQLEGPPGHRG